MRRLPIVFVLLVLALAAPRAGAQPFPARVEARGLAPFSAEVRDVAPWGLWLADGRGLLFRLIDHIETPSDTLRALLVAAAPGAQVSGGPGAYTIRFDGLTFPRRIPRERRARPDLAVTAGAAVGSRIGLETDLTVMTPYTGPLVAQAGHQIGVNGDGYVGGVTLGVGARLPMGRWTLTVLANAWTKYVDAANVPSYLTNGDRVPRVAQSAFSVTALGDLPLGADGRFGLQAGARYYVDDVELKHDALPVEALVALRMRL